MYRASDRISQLSLENFWTNGFSIVPDFFTEHELESYLNIASDYYVQDTSPEENYLRVTSGILGTYDSQKILLSNKILSVSSQILNCKPIFFGHALAWWKPSISSLDFIPLRDKSNLAKILPPYGSKAQIDAKGSEENLFGVRHGISEKYPVIRFGWFQQNFLNRSLSIRVYPGSHFRGVTSHEVEPIYCDVGPRDLLVFSLKTVHSALSLNPKYERHDQPELYVLTPSQEVHAWETIPESFCGSPCSRNAIFWDFSNESRIAELFIRNRALASTREVYGRSYLINFNLSYYFRNLVRSGLVGYREDLRLLALMKWDSKVSLKELQDIKSRINFVSNVPLESDFVRYRNIKRSATEVNN